MRRDWGATLGFACVIEGDKKLKAADGRRPENHPHLRHSLRGLWEVFDYLHENNIRVFRLPSSLIPYATHPDHPHLHWKQQIREARDEIAETRRRLERQPLRLSFHPSQFILLNSPRAEVHRNSLDELRWQCRLLDMFGQGPEARVLLHAGGVYDDRPAARKRLLRNIEKLPEEIHSRLALENDDRLWNAREVQEVCQETNVPMIFDIHHHQCHQDGRSWQKALRGALATWPRGVRGKIHFSSPRLQANERGSLNLRAHADFIDPWVFRNFCQEVEAGRYRQFDIMLEAKKKDLALLQLRESLRAEE